MLTLAKKLDINKVECTMETQDNKFGFTNFAERWNGRLAMLGFVIGVAVEYATGHGILEQIGLM